tara:strand:- start:272 stop:619 length:348 start_codon:yes stop_codon:yes gene_type:complete
MQESDKIRFIAEYKEKLYLDNFYKEITIDFNNYFKYSGKIEKGKRFKFYDMPINNEIFDTYRMEVAEIHKALRKLVKHGYTVIDLEGQVVTKWNIDDENKPNVNYKRAPKLPQTE